MDEGSASKTASFQILLRDGENIAMTHELLSRQELSPHLLKTIEAYGYTLILDEVIEVIQPVASLTKDDARILFDQGWISVDDKTR